MNLGKLTKRFLPSGSLLALMPYAQAVQGDLPMGRLTRLSLFQLSVGMAAVLLTGTLNRVMVIELGQPDRKSTRLNSSHPSRSRMPSSA